MGLFDFLANDGSNAVPPSSTEPPGKGTYGMFGNSLLGNPNFAQLLMQIGAGIAGPHSVGAAVGTAGSAMARQIQMQNAIKALQPPTSPNMPGANTHTIKVTPDKITTTTEVPANGGQQDNPFGGGSSPESNVGSGNGGGISGGPGISGPAVNSQAPGGKTYPFL